MGLYAEFCEEKLEQDNFSIKRPRFGEEGQLQIVGWVGKNRSGTKYYILKCTKCSEDVELYGLGYFKATKLSLVSGSVPCGCSKNTKWTKAQFLTLCSRKAIELGYTFLGFEGEWKGQKTLLQMFCPLHGTWTTGRIGNLLLSGRGCPGCKLSKTIARSIKPEDEMIQSFFDSGAFHPDTKFWRSGRLTKLGVKRYWFMDCPECGQTGETTSCSLQIGHRPCLCSKHRQQEAYISQIINKDVVVAIKFGIANNSRRRQKQQNSVSPYIVEGYAKYKFETVNSCKQAERLCKKELECGVLTKEEMPDGYTETTYLHNLSRIIEIYEENGGVLINQNINKGYFEFSNNQEVTK